MRRRNGDYSVKEKLERYYNSQYNKMFTGQEGNDEEDIEIDDYDTFSENEDLSIN